MVGLPPYARLRAVLERRTGAVAGVMRTPGGEEVADIRRNGAVVQQEEHRNLLVAEEDTARMRFAGIALVVAGGTGLAVVVGIAHGGL